MFGRLRPLHVARRDDHVGVADELGQRDLRGPLRDHDPTVGSRQRLEHALDREPGGSRGRDLDADADVRLDLATIRVEPGQRPASLVTAKVSQAPVHDVVEDEDEDRRSPRLGRRSPGRRPGPHCACGRERVVPQIVRIQRCTPGMVWRALATRMGPFRGSDGAGRRSLAAGLGCTMQQHLSP